MWFFLLLISCYFLYAYKKYSHLFSLTRSKFFHSPLQKQTSNHQTHQLSKKARQYELAHLYHEASSFYRQLLLKTQHPNDAYRLCLLLVRMNHWEEIHEISQVYQYDARMLHLYFHSLLILNHTNMPGIDAAYKYHPLHPQFEIQAIEIAIKRWPITTLSRHQLPMKILFELVCQRPSRLRIQIFCDRILNATGQVYQEIKNLSHPEWLNINSASDLYQFALINARLLECSFLITCTQCHHKLAEVTLMCHYCGAVESFSEIPHVEKNTIGASI